MNRGSLAPLVPTELVERLSAATVGSRELDALIHGIEHGYERNDGTFMLEVHGIETFQFRHPTLRHPNGPAALYISGYAVPEVSTSLDAALALAERVFGHCFWQIGHHAVIDGQRFWDAYLSREGDPALHEGEAWSAPLAVCAAILKALAAQASDTAGGEKTEGAHVE